MHGWQSCSESGGSAVFTNRSSAAASTRTSGEKQWLIEIMPAPPRSHSLSLAPKCKCLPSPLWELRASHHGGAALPAWASAWTPSVKAPVVGMRGFECCKGTKCRLEMLDGSNVAWLKPLVQSFWALRLALALLQWWK